jgi:hypothetical protein
LAIRHPARYPGLGTSNGILSPLRGRNAKMRLSLYADDAVIFLNPVQEEVTALFAILEQFGGTTGLKLNLDKCTACPIRCANMDLDHILSGFGGSKAAFPITYLGLPLTLGKLKMTHLQTLIDKSRAKLAGWQGRLLNQAGRRELVRSVLSAIPAYLLTSTRVPKELTKEIDKVRRRFLWAGDAELTGGNCKVAWAAVAKPVEYGGLGIIDLGRFSRALRLRWLWFSWTSPERPWCGSELPIDDEDLALFNAATIVNIRNGAKASFWKSSWMDGRTLASMYPLLYMHSRRKNRTVRDAVTNGNWIRDIAHNLNHELLREFFDLWTKIDAAGLRLDDEREDTNNTITWTIESSGEYSAKSACKIQFAGHLASNYKDIIWKAWAPPKCKFFVWLLLQDRLWTAARLQVRGWKNNYFCALCERSLETAEHLFFECPFSRVVWQLVASWSSCVSMQPSNWTVKAELEDWYVHTMEPGGRREHSLAILTLWTLWNRRNAIIFRNCRATAAMVLREIQDAAREWSRAGCIALSLSFVAQTSSE